MKLLSLSSVLSFGVASVVIATLPVSAQVVSIPVTNGSFAVTGTAGGPTYSSPLTLLSPAGTINLTNPPLPSGGGTITTNTAIGLYFDNLSGSANLTDGRTASFTNTGYLKLETLASVTGAANSPVLPTVPGVTVNYAIQSGSLSVPATSLSNYPTPQFSVPITGGTFTLNAGTAPGADTVTLNSVLTPLGTTTLTLTLPDLTTPTAPDILIGTTSQSVLLHGTANGSVAFNDGTGRIATITNRLVSLQATANVTSGSTFWYGEALPGAATTIQGTIASGSISVPQTAVAVPAPTQPVIPVVPTTPTTPTTPITSTPATTSSTQRPLPVPVAPQVAPPAAPPAPTFTVSIARDFTLDTNPLEFIYPSDRRAEAGDLPEVETSALGVSRIHPGLRSLQ